MAEYISKSEEETAQIARDFIKKLSPKKEATVVGLYGDLGAGKSVFTRAVAEALGVKENIQSPTFVIMKTYNFQLSTFNFLIHIDAYRLENARELEVLDWKEITADKSNLVFVEWAERVEEILPKGFIRVNFEHLSETERRISILV